MLRITTHNGPGGVALKLEGWITGAWVGELESSWRAATASAPPGRVCIDLRDVYFVDDDGRELLTRMYRAGAAFTTKGCVMPEMVREIAGDARPAGRH